MNEKAAPYSGAAQISYDLSLQNRHAPEMVLALLLANAAKIAVAAMHRGTV
jgi:hypothetical protein